MLDIINVFFLYFCIAFTRMNRWKDLFQHIILENFKPFLGKNVKFSFMSSMIARTHLPNSIFFFTYRKIYK